MIKLKVFNIELDTCSTQTAFEGTMSIKDYNAYCMHIKIFADGKRMDLNSLSDIAIHYQTSGGKTGQYRLVHDNLYIDNNLLIFEVPAHLVRDVGYVIFQVQLFLENSRMTALSKFQMDIAGSINEV